MSSEISAGRSTPDRVANVRPEAALLLACARLVVPAGDVERIRHMVGHHIDWVYLFTVAGRHGLLPLVFRHLNSLGGETLPKAIFVELWGHYERNARSNRVMAKALLEVLQILESNDIPAIGYKGPPLAASLYGDLALREFGDLDILLRPQDVLPAKRLLQARGYAPAYDLRPAVEAAFLRASLHYHLIMIQESSGLIVELHWKTDNNFPVGALQDDRWWTNLGRIGLEGEMIRCFADEELLLILCIHGSKHAWSRLRWLVDIAELIRQRADLDWDWILDKAASLECQRRLALGLYLARELLDVSLPDKVWHSLSAKREIIAASENIIGALFSLDFPVTRALARLRLNLSLYDRPAQRAAHCLNVVLAPTLIEWTRWPLPRALFVLYIPLRVFRLIAKYAIQFTFRIRGR